MKKALLFIIALLAFVTFGVNADENYTMYVPSCVVPNNNRVYIPLEFAIRNEKTFKNASEGKLLLLNLRDTASCSVQSLKSELFGEVVIEDDNAVYGVFKSNYSDGSIMEDDYNLAHTDGVFDYSYFQTSFVLSCERNIDIDNNYYYELNENNKITVGDDNYCNYVNGLFNKEYTYKVVDDSDSFSDVFVEGVDVLESNPDILYLVLLVTLTLIFFFILLEVKKQNNYSKNYNKKKK